ncbi:MAG: hypothetical protein ABFS38_17920 [Bacteroidota bacterium]
MGRIAGKYLIFSICILAVQQLATAQFNANLDLSSNFDDNIYLSPEKISDWIYDMDLSLDYTFKDTATNIFYNLDYLRYQQNPARNFFLNKAGIRYSNDFGKKRQNWFYVGGYFMDRRNTDTYSYYDYQQLYLYTNQRFVIKKTYLRTGYNFRYRRYMDFMELTNYQHYLYLQLSRSFRTRTSLIMEADLGYKTFYTTTTYTRTTTESGQGRFSTTHYRVTEEQIPSMSHAIVLLRVAQSLHDRVGIYLQYRGQFSLSDASRINAGSYFQDEELFDDPFSYTSHGLSSRLTMILPENLQIRAGGGVTMKDYISETSFISETDSIGAGPLREDLRFNAYARVSKTFSFKDKWIDSIKPYLNYTYVNNQSNSYWYDYNYHFLGVGVVFNF